MVEKLKKNILQTVCYYDVLDYPMTIFEVWKYLICEKGDEIEDGYSLKEVAEILTSGELRNFLENKNGFYFLRGREKLVRQRIARNKISVLKIKRMRRWVKIISMAPFVRMILVTGRLAMKNAQPQSDWDVLVVLREKRIWIGRTFVTIFSHILGKRRYNKKVQDRLCFNYFIATDSLEIRNKDLFSANEYFFCFPLFETRNYFQKFQLRNAWIRNYKPNYYLQSSDNLFTQKDGKFFRAVRIFLENLFDHDFLENYLKKVESRKIKDNPKTKNSSGMIDYDDKALIFLPNPHGPEVFEKFKERLEGLGV